MLSPASASEGETRMGSNRLPIIQAESLQLLVALSRVERSEANLGRHIPIHPQEEINSAVVVASLPSVFPQKVLRNQVPKPFLPMSMVSGNEEHATF